MHRTWNFNFSQWACIVKSDWLIECKPDNSVYYNGRLFAICRTKTLNGGLILFCTEILTDQIECACRFHLNAKKNRTCRFHLKLQHFLAVTGNKSLWYQTCRKFENNICRTKKFVRPTWYCYPHCLSSTQIDEHGRFMWEWTMFLSCVWRNYTWKIRLQTSAFRCQTF
jgi:hypothetical protein